MTGIQVTHNTVMTTFVEKMSDGGVQSGIRFSGFTDEAMAELVATSATRYLADAMNKIAPGAALKVEKQELN